MCDLVEVVQTWMLVVGLLKSLLIVFHSCRLLCVRPVYIMASSHLLLLSTHSLDPCLWGEPDHPAFGLPVSLSLHLASSSITPAGSVHKSRGDNVVCMWVQLKEIVCECYKGGIVVMDVIWRRLCVTMI